MEIPTDFNTFKVKGIRVIGEVKKAILKRDWRWLTAWLIYASVLVILTTFLIIGTITSGLEAVGMIKENIFEPKQQLTYTRQSETLNDKGLYVTVFKLTVSSPPNYFGQKLVFKYPSGCDVKNMVPSDPGIELKNGLTYSNITYSVSCVTKEKIVDNTNFLFRSF